MALDPRLANETLLRLAAYRLTHGPRPLPPGPEGEGLAALLDYARQLPPRDPPEAHEHSTGLARLLWECRQRVQEREQ